MKFFQICSYVLATATASAAQASAIPRAEKPPYFVLTGDSTVAVAGGWGDGFLSFLQKEADGVNPAKSGATTVSFRRGGLWDTAIKSVEDNKAKYTPYVTIQFGHNDQKGTSGISMDQFRTNLETMVDEVRNAGGIPILLTSLTRRRFSGGKVIENLVDVRAETIAASVATKATLIDLNDVSTKYVNAIGDANASNYDLPPNDKTHLNPTGEKVFGRMVVDLVLQKYEGLEKYFTPGGELSRKIAAGEFATGDE
ncbi:hypothetical protein F66182_8470 [Fusarium sp. NRRL 66182]|nr:hypothetical protein F66182_8470 [Fusarium sp. NRRL 66182]